VRLLGEPPFSERFFLFKIYTKLGTEGRYKCPLIYYRALPTRHCSFMFRDKDKWQTVQWTMDFWLVFYKVHSLLCMAAGGAGRFSQMHVKLHVFLIFTAWFSKKVRLVNNIPTCVY
jgi:hypothetical protein